MARKCSCVTYDNQTREITAGECIEGCSNECCMLANAAHTKYNVAHK